MAFAVMLLSFSSTAVTTMRVPTLISSTYTAGLALTFVSLFTFGRSRPTRRRRGARLVSECACEWDTSITALIWLAPAPLALVQSGCVNR
jgi:hypothetical protein